MTNETPNTPNEFEPQESDDQPDTSGADRARDQGDESPVVPVPSETLRGAHLPLNAPAPQDEDPGADDYDAIPMETQPGTRFPPRDVSDAGVLEHAEDVMATAGDYDAVPVDTQPGHVLPRTGILPDEDSAQVDELDRQTGLARDTPEIQVQGGRRPFTRIDVLVYAVLAAVLLVGGWLRFDAQNWDDYTHLHPDERFLTDVISSLGGDLRFEGTQAEQDAHMQRCLARYPVSDDPDQLPLAAGHGGYFDAECSPLNPNNVGKGLYVYGEFPLFTVHAAGVARSELSRDVHAYLAAFDPDSVDDHTITTYWEGYTGAQLVGRTISATADWLTILVLFLLARRLYGRWTGLLAAGFYAFAAFPIQQSHFWTVDAFTTFWVTLALYFAVRAMDGATERGNVSAFGYLAIWAGAVTWDAASQHYPVLGLASLGIVFVITLGLLALARLALAGFLRRGAEWGDALIAGSGMMAAVIYLAGWTVLNLTAERPFTLIDGIQSLGFVALIFGMAVWITYVAVSVVRHHAAGRDTYWASTLAVGAVGIMWTALVFGYLIGGLSPYATLLIAVSTVALLIFDLTDLTDYAWFGIALGGAVASRVNVAPLAGIIVLAALIKALPALDVGADQESRERLILRAVAGVFVAAVLSFFVFRLAQPHAFEGPHIWNIFPFNSGWREDLSTAADMTSGGWDAPPNHQWANRTPYLFPWRNIVLWGFGIPLGLAAWIAWAWAGVAIARGRALWTRHLLLFAWILVAFGWLGGRWVMTMRYFLPLYPALAALAAWALVALVREARRIYLTPRPPLHSIGRGSHTAFESMDSGARAAMGRADHRASAMRRPSFSGRGAKRLMVGAASALLVLVLGYTVLYGFAFHTIHRHQLTRVAASRWFQETVPGDLGIWIEGADGSRQMVNVGRGFVAVPPNVTYLDQGDSVTFNLRSDGMPITLPGDAVLTRVILHRAADPAADPEPETIRVRLYKNDPSLGGQVVYEGTIAQDLTAEESPYGRSVALVPDDEILLAQSENGLPVQYVVEITVLEGGPVMFVPDIVDASGVVSSDISIGLQLQADRTLTFIDLNFNASPLLTGHGDDIPETPTHWTVGGSDLITFTAPIDGVIRRIEIPHLGDPLKDADEETVRFVLTAPDGTTTSATVHDDFNAGADPLGPARTVVFDPPLVVQTHDAAGEKQIYTLAVEAKDPIYTSGPVIAWEGSWDDPVPWPVCPLPDDVQYRDDLPSGLSDYTCGSLGMYNSYYQGIQLWMVAEDNEQKVHAITNALDQADYIVITSNRFYDSLSRIPQRWPMTLAYYDALFDGKLGFELIKTFESPPTLGPITIRDQVLPTDDLPDFLNEHWEAEEAFSVYDHPVVMVFRKTDAYSPENLRAVLNSVSLRSINTAGMAYIADPEPVGVIPWGAKEAGEAKNFQQLSDEKWKIQTEGGTWSDLFDLDSLINRSETTAVIVWWLLIVIVGWITWPLLFAIFPALPDRGFPAAKITGWLIVAWLAWVGGTLNLLTWTRGGIAILLVLLAGLSLAIIWRRRADYVRYIRANVAHILAMEALTLLLFVGFLWVRAGNPDLWHTNFGGEKPMDFAFFNGVLRSTVFPPLNPWASGEYINYYYFGYVIVGAPVKLIGLDPAVAYNLIVPTLYAMTGIGVFGVAYNWVRSRDTIPGAITSATGRPLPPTPQAEEGNRTRAPRIPRGNPWVAGIMALLLAVVLGNLGTLYVVFTEVAKMGGYERGPMYFQHRTQELERQRAAIYEDFYDEEMDRFRDKHDREPDAGEASVIALDAQIKTDDYIDDQANHPPIYRLWVYEFDNARYQIKSFFKGLRKVLSGEPLPMATHRWHWAPTRIISELPNQAGGGAIAEMPYFTFLYGDLHAHMMAFPITLLVLLWLLAEIIGAGHSLRAWWESGLALALGGVAVGVLRPTNSWDWITYMLLGVTGLTYVAWVGAVRTTEDRPPSEWADRVWDWLRPGNARHLLLALIAVPGAMLARVGFYAFQRLQADQQAARGLKPGETLIDPTLTLSSVIVWVIAGVALVVLAYVALLIWLRARATRNTLVDWIGRVGLFVAITFIAGMPFTAYFATGYDSVNRWDQATTPLWAYLYIHGTFVFIVISFLVWQTARWLRSVRVWQLQGLAIPVIVVGGGAALIVLGGIVFGARDAAVAQLVVPLVVWAAILFFLPDQHPLLRVTYALIALALTISLGVELVVLEGDIGRQNTVFKFYLQVWFFLSIVGGVTLAWMFYSMWRWRAGLRGGWQVALLILFTIALIYPVLATQARWQDRFDYQNAPRSLDGMQYMTYAVHGEYDLWFPLQGDYDMIRWLQQHVEGTPVIAEAQFAGVQYHWSNRISIYTGLPTILGWSWHEIQQHSVPGMDKLIHARENNVSAFYEMGGPDGIVAAQGLIDHYQIVYIVVGALERAYYDDIQRDPVSGEQTAGHAPGLAKFDTMVDLGLLEVAYDAPRCIDYGITDIEECPSAQVYHDKIYRVIKNGPNP